jgi:AraC family transcriptional regulator
MRAAGHRPIDAESSAVRERVRHHALRPWQIERIKSYVEANICGRLRVEDLARIVDLSSSHFCRIFKPALSCTVHGYVTHRRMEMAKRLMLETPDNLCNIALSCGMSDQAHLTRCFHRHVGVTPSVWRRAQRERFVGVQRSAERTSPCNQNCTIGQ